jgi:hypothetical protein
LGNNGSNFGRNLNYPTSYIHKSVKAHEQGLVAELVFNICLIQNVFLISQAMDWSSLKGFLNKGIINLNGSLDVRLNANSHYCGCVQNFSYPLSQPALGSADG